MKTLLKATAVTSLLAVATAGTLRAATVSGQVTRQGGSTPVAAARVTLFTADLSFFREARSDAGGLYTFGGVTAGAYRLGVSSTGLEYSESALAVAEPGTQSNVSLGAETEQGRWDILREFLGPNTFGGTNSGVLLADGRIMYCHDTLDPVILDPVANQITQPPQSPREQGCHAVCLMGREDNLLIYVGGADVPVYGPGTRQVKTFDPAASAWSVLPDMTDFRWYPSMAQLTDGELLVVGGGGINNPQRVNTSETFDPASRTWTPAGNVALGNEVSPIVLLYTGEVLMTHRPPQLYNRTTRQWRRAGDFVQGPRTPDGDHSDHELILLPDGQAVAIGYKSYTPGVIGSLVEIYNPASDAWRLGADFAPVRSRASCVLLPDQRILVCGGYKQDPNDPTPVNAWGYTALTDLYDPATNSWRRLAGLNVAREYHAMPILVPDGRIIVVGGEEMPGVDPSKNTVEAFTPPYLLRGVRPEIASAVPASVARGGSLVFTVDKTAAPTSVILMGTSASTHFMDSGHARYLELSFTQSGRQVTAQVPADPVTAPLGYYTLFVMVDDIPSTGRILRIDPVAPAPPRDPDNPPGAVSGLDYAYYTGTWNALPDFTGLAPVTTGTAAGFDLTPRTQNDNFAFRFSGFIEVSAEGVYTFYTTSDDGSRLTIGATQVVDNDGIHAMIERSGTIALKAGKHALIVTMFENAGGEGLEVRYAGPGIAKTLIPASILFRVPGGGGSNQPPTVSLTGPASGASYTAPATVNLSASASDGDGTVTRVEFLQGTTLLGEDTTSPYSFAWSGVAAGTYSLAARATDNAGGTATSSAVSITVTTGGGGGTDTDSDGLPDAWETQYFGNLNQTAAGDSDADGLTNQQEYAAGSNPTLADTDGDGMRDGGESAAGFNPLSGDQNGNGVTDGLDDWDGDGVNNQTELANGTSAGTPPAPAPATGGGGGGGGGGGCFMGTARRIPR